MSSRTWRAGNCAESATVTRWSPPRWSTRSTSGSSIRSTFDADQARIVELRFFGGLSVEETAEAVGVSRATVMRDWAMARAWLHHKLTAA